MFLFFSSFLYFYSMSLDLKNVTGFFWFDSDSVLPGLIVMPAQSHYHLSILRFNHSNYFMLRTIDPFPPITKRVKNFGNFKNLFDNDEILKCTKVVNIDLCQFNVTIPPWLFKFITFCISFAFSFYLSFMCLPTQIFRLVFLPKVTEHFKKKWVFFTWCVAHFLSSFDVYLSDYLLMQV